MPLNLLLLLLSKQCSHSVCNCKLATCQLIVSWLSRTAFGPPPTKTKSAFWYHLHRQDNEARLVYKLLFGNITTTHIVGKFWSVLFVFAGGGAAWQNGDRRSSVCVRVWCLSTRGVHACAQHTPEMKWTPTSEKKNSVVSKTRTT